MTPWKRTLSLALTAPAVVALASTMHGQAVHHVGPTQPHATIQSAVDLAANGDLILVDPGTYPPFTVPGTGGATDLSILHTGFGYTISSVSSTPEILVQNVPAGDTVTIAGAFIDYSDMFAPAVLVQNNAGAVRLTDFNVDTFTVLDGTTAQAAIEVSNTDTFWLVDSSIWSSFPVGFTVNPRSGSSLNNDGLSALQMVGSKGMIQDSRLRGYNDPNNLHFGGDGIRVVGLTSTWLLRDVGTGAFGTNFTGGDGTHGGFAIHQYATAFDPQRNRSCGGPLLPSYAWGQGLVVDGSVFGFNNSRVMASSGGGGVAFLYPEHCVPNGQNQVSIAQTLVPIGTNLQARILTQKARDYWLFISPSTKYDATLSPFLGRAMLDPNVTQLFQSTGTTTAGVTKVDTFAVPNDPSLIGVQLTLQCVMGPVGGAFDWLSLPSLAVIGP